MSIENRIREELFETILGFPTDFDPMSPEGLPLYRMAPPLAPDPAVKVTEETVPACGDAPAVKVYVFEPAESDEVRPGLLYFHGGGYAGGHTLQSAETLYMLVKETGCVIVSPEYRLAPENPYPAGLEDCYRTLEWFAGNAAALRVDLDRIAVTGCSSGGGMTIAVCLMARDRKGPNICFQMPAYPTMDDRLDTVSSHQITYNRVLNRSSCENIWNMYLGVGHEKREVPVYAAPGRAEDLKDMPPCYSFVGDLDPHRDETIAYISKLVSSGVPTGFTLYNGCYHGFEAIVPQAEVSREANRQMVEALKRAFQV